MVFSPLILVLWSTQRPLVLAGVPPSTMPSSAASAAVEACRCAHVAFVARTITARAANHTQEYSYAFVVVAVLAKRLL